MDTEPGNLQYSFQDLSAACTCYAAAAALVEATKLLKCSAKKTFETVRDAKSVCLASFSGCKKAEDASVGRANQSFLLKLVTSLVLFY